MRNGKCDMRGDIQTSKIPTRVTHLFIFYSVPNLKQSFRLFSENDTLHDPRNHATDFVLIKPKENLAKEVLNKMKLSIGIVYLIKNMENPNHI